MNKNDLSAAVADKAGVSKTQAADAVDAVLDTITAALKSGDEVRLIGFGTFATSHRKESKGRNPATGAEITIGASTLAKFRPGKALKDALN